MSILCALGRHRPGPRPRWNDGYYFSTCRGCGRDLVRTPFERWSVPAGYRVVWSHRPPASRSTARLAPEQELVHGGAALQAYGSPAPPLATRTEQVPAPDTSNEPAPMMPPPPDADHHDAPAERSAFAWADAQPAAPSDPGREAGAPTGDLSIGEVLRILREEESRAGETPGTSAASPAGVDDSSPGEGPPEGGTIASEGDPLELGLEQVAPESTAPPALDIEHPAAERAAPNDAAPTVTFPEPGVDAPGVADTVQQAPLPIAPDNGRFDDFMDEREAPPSESGFWMPEPDSEASSGEAPKPTVPDPGPFGPGASSSEDAREEGPAAATDESNDIAAPMAARQVPRAADDDRALAPALWAALAARAAQAPAPDEGIAGASAMRRDILQVKRPLQARRRDRKRARTGLRVAIAAAAALAAAAIVTKVNGSETPFAGAGADEAEAEKAAAGN